MCDYLSTHRFRIYDNLMHNFRVISQSKTIYTKLTGIIVLDQLLAMVPAMKVSPVNNDSSKTIYENMSASFGCRQAGYS